MKTVNEIVNDLKSGNTNITYCPNTKNTTVTINNNKDYKEYTINRNGKIIKIIKGQERQV